MLAGARNRGQAIQALRRFTEAFDDGHFRLDAPPSALERLAQRLTGREHEEGPLSAGLDGEAACTRLGVRERRRKIAWEKLDGYRAMGGGTASHPFLAGIVVAADRQSPLAVLRIDLFSFEAYPALCAAQWEEYRHTLRGDCEETCKDDFALRLESALSERLATELEELSAAGSHTLLIDLTGNGGGSSVADPWARELTPIRLKLPQLGFVRHPHWSRQLSTHLQSFATDLARPGLDPALRELLLSARAQAETLKQEVDTPCVLAGLWSQQEPTLPCSPIVRGLYAGGYVEYVAPGALASLESRGILFQPSQYVYREGVWQGELLVLVDGRTASAAEYVTALLRDNGAARIVGEKTDGSGCGYTNGGIRLELPSLGVRVRMPDCVRYRRDGSSEAEGITPDILVAWEKGDDEGTRARKALAAVPR
jgi:hypothetical protein